MVSDNAIPAINARAEELRGQGRDVISLAAGEPDTPTAAHITAAGGNVIEVLTSAEDGFLVDIDVRAAAVTAPPTRLARSTHPGT
ncbi:MAG: hypothetical protein DLM58_12615 [Pseudonocardiales bacterium]|nr:MAG: hypothetical protein DLM58_12615 [Pseudonocardiales bacterium]